MSSKEHPRNKKHHSVRGSAKRDSPRHQDMLGGTQLESSSAEEVLVDAKLNINQQCDPAAKKANSVLSCLRQSVASRRSKVILPLSTGKATTGGLCPDLGFKRSPRETWMHRRETTKTGRNGHCMWPTSGLCPHAGP